MKTHPLPVYLQRFFTDRLATQLKASPNTVASYRDTFRLLLRYAAGRLRRSPTDLQVADIDAELIGLFLADIEGARGNSARSRNTRLSAIRSFFKYVAVNEPQLLHHCQRILAMPPKRHEKRAIDYLSRGEIEALIAAPDLSSWHGRRDRALLALALQTGLRISELIGLSCADIALGAGAHVRCMGKGRKERATPIRKDSLKMLRGWLAERDGADADPVFVSNRNQRLSRDAIEQIVRKHVQSASVGCPSLKKKRVTPHVLRHSAAMQLLQNGVDRTVIALWLGHESVETTQVYKAVSTWTCSASRIRTAITAPVLSGISTWVAPGIGTRPKIRFSSARSGPRRSFSAAKRARASLFAKTPRPSTARRIGASQSTKRAGMRSAMATAC